MKNMSLTEEHLDKHQSHIFLAIFDITTLIFIFMFKIVVVVQRILKSQECLKDDTRSQFITFTKYKIKLLFELYLPVFK